MIFSCQERPFQVIMDMVQDLSGCTALTAQEMRHHCLTVLTMRVHL